jgi:hypothetical protein
MPEPHKIDAAPQHRFKRKMVENKNEDLSTGRVWQVNFFASPSQAKLTEVLLNYTGLILQFATVWKIAKEIFRSSNRLSRGNDFWDIHY